MTTIQRVRYIGKPLVFAACLVPALLVVSDLFGITGTLGANPVEEILDRFGNWGLRFMMIALAVTPLRFLTGYNWIGLFRRMLGLFAAFYVFVHFAVWLVLDQGVYLPGIVEDIVERPFIVLDAKPVAIDIEFFRHAAPLTPRPADIHPNAACQSTR